MLGFLLGMLSMYSIMPTQTCDYQASKLIAPNVNPVLQFGNPGPIHDLLERDAYVASYNRKDRIPHWVGERLTSENIKIGTGVSRNKSKFVDDPDVPLMFKVFTRDYTNSGYDRGHMAPAADAVSTQKGMDETFLLSNIAPQVGVGFNRHYWAYLESFCRNLTRYYPDVYVYTGPLFLPQQYATNTSTTQTAGKKAKYRLQYDVIGAVLPTIAVPTHYYKTILIPTNSTYLSASFILPNQNILADTPLSNFQVDLKAIETASGLQFFQELNRQQFQNLCGIVKCSF